MIPLLAGALIGAGASIFGNAMNVGSTISANNQNLKIAQMNNEFNERMLQKQMDYNTEMWNKQNAYNSASAQRDRLSAAGLNPYMMLDGGNAGTAQSAGGITTPTATPVQVSAPQVDFSGIGDSIGTFLSPDSKLKQEQAEGIRIENKYKAAEIIASLGETISRTKNNDMQNALMRIQRSLALETFNSDVNYKKELAQQVRLQNQGILVQNALQSKELHSYDQRLRMSLAVQSSQIMASEASANASYAQAAASYAQAMVSRANAEGIKISNELARKTFDDQVTTAYNQMVISGHQATKEQHLSTEAKWKAVKAELNSGPDNMFTSAHQIGKSAYSWYQEKKNNPVVKDISRDLDFLFGFAGR